MCPRSASSPSDTSIIDVAPDAPPTIPAASGGSGTRYAPTAAAGERNPLDSTANPAAAQPSRPITATTSPARAPERSTGFGAAQIAQRGHRDGQHVRAGQVPADDPGAGLRRLLLRVRVRWRSPARSACRAVPSGRPAGPSATRPWRPRRPSRPARPAGRSARRSPSPCGSARRRPARRRWPPPGRRGGDHRTVVARPEQGRRRLPGPGGDRVDHRELAGRAMVPASAFAADAGWLAADPLRFDRGSPARSGSVGRRGAGVC